MCYTRTEMQLLVSRTLLGIALVASACSSSDKTKDDGTSETPATAKPLPLPQAILGTWELYCYSRLANATSCPGKYDRPGLKTFDKDGSITSGMAIKSGTSSGSGMTMRGTWKLDGTNLTITFKGGGMKLKERSRARVHNGLLILARTDGVTEIYHRQGATLPAPKGVLARAGRVTKRLNGVEYSVELPAGYFFAYDSKHRQRWDHRQAAGHVRVHIGVSSRPRPVGGEPAPCERAKLSFGSSSSLVDGKRRDDSVSAHTCVPGSHQSITCSVDHPRGYLNDADKAAARRLCGSLMLAK